MGLNGGEVDTGNSNDIEDEAVACASNDDVDADGNNYRKFVYNRVFITCKWPIWMTAMPMAIVFVMIQNEEG
jgi:hypothetical protein